VSRGLLDTSVFIAKEPGRSLDESSMPEELAVSVVTVGELRAGVLSPTT
jgi:predicted nucleic acid-binding protein